MQECNHKWVHVGSVQRHNGKDDLRKMIDLTDKPLKKTWLNPFGRRDPMATLTARRLAQSFVVDVGNRFICPDCGTSKDVYKEG
jgi:hypothetical protein